MFHGLKTPRGAIYFCLGIGVFMLWLGPQIWVAYYEKDTNHQMMSPETFQTIIPLGLLFYCLLTLVLNIGEKAIHFSPAEIDFLFTRPYHRRELLVYKLTNNAFNTVFASLFASVFLFRFTHNFFLTMVGLFFTFVFLSNLTILVLLFKQVVTARAYTLLRRGVLATLGLVAAALLWYFVKLEPAAGWIDLVRQFQQSLPGKMLLGPFVPFARLIVSNGNLTEFALWLLTAGSINAALVAGIIRLDANYYEIASDISMKFHRLIQQRRKGRQTPFAASKSESHTSIPMLPVWKGIGPIAWRQFSTAYRNSKVIFIMLPILCLVVGPMLFDRKFSEQDLMPFMFILTWMAIFMSQMIPFDFRSDIDRMDWLKVLPIHSMSITIGQLLVPVIFFTILQFLLYMGVALFFEKVRWVLLGMLCFLLPFNFLLFSVDNLFFLLFPTRIVQPRPGDFQQFGRNIFLFFIRILFLMATLALSAAMGFLVYWLTASVMLGLILGWIVMAGSALSLVPWIAYAFERFDPSIHVPAGD